MGATAQATGNLVSWEEFYTEMNRLTSHQIYVVQVAAVGNSETNTIQGMTPVQEACTVVSGSCEASATTASAKVRLYNGSASPAALTALTGELGDFTPITFTFSDTSLAAGDNIAVYCTTDGSGVITLLGCTVLVKRANLTD